MKNIDFIYTYWSRTEIGQMMLESDIVSDSDLLFMIPNNVKRMHGLPVTRVYGKRKSLIKQKRKRIILSFQLFDLISETIDNMLNNNCNEEFFQQFVDVKNVEIEDKNVFKPSCIKLPGHETIKAKISLI